MGGMFSSKQKTSSTQRTEVPLNFSQLMDRTISFANEGLDTPFQAYNAPRIAELSANEQAGISAAGAQAGMYQPLIDMAMTNNADMQARGGIPTSGDLNQFINPYVDFVLGNSLDRLQEQSDTNMTKIGSTAAMSGAFGGIRHGVLEGANLAELLKSARDLSASTYSDAYDKGMGNWFRSQDLRRGTIRDALDIANQGSAYNRGDINTLMQTGLVGRTRDQSVLDFAFSEFMREQQDPFTKAGFASSILSSYPTNLFTRNATSETTNTPSPFSQIAGIGMAAAGLMTGNPAAAAGLMSGQQALGAAGIGSSNSGSEGWFLDDLYKHNIKRAKGGLIKKYNEGGKIEYVPMEGMLDEPLIETPYFKDKPKRNDVDWDLAGNLSDVYDWIMETIPAYENLPILYPYSEEEERTQKFVKGVGPELDKRALTRKLLEDRLTTSKYGRNNTSQYVLDLYADKIARDNLKQAKWNEKHAPIAHEELANITTRTDPLEDFLVPDSEFVRQYTKTLSSGPQDKKKKYAWGGQVNNAPATMVEAFNSNRNPQAAPMGVESEFGKAIFESLTGRNRNSSGGSRGVQNAPYTPRPQTPYDWSAFYERQGLNRIPTAQSNINPNYANASARPDLSMFMEMLQQRLGGQGGGGGQLPQPPFQTFAKGGLIEDITHLLGVAPKREWSKEMENDSDPLYLPLDAVARFMPTNEVYGGGNTLPISDLLEEVRPFRLALQKHETGVKEYDNPNYFANSFRGKKKSHAFGLGQWQPDSWNDYAKKWNKENPNNTVRLMSQDAVKANKLPTKEEQDKIWTLWEQDLVANNKGDYAKAFAEHQLGRGALNKILNVDPNTKMSFLNYRNKDGELVDIAGNVSASKETVGQYLNRLRGMVDDARKWEIDRLKRKGGVATDIMRKGPMLMSTKDQAFNREYYPQDILEAVMAQKGVDAQPFQRKGDMVTPALPPSPAGASASARTEDGNYQIEDYAPHRATDGRVSRVPTNRQGKPRTFNSPLEIITAAPQGNSYLDTRIQDPSYYPEVTEEDFLPAFTRGRRQLVPQDDIERMLMESGIDPQPFKKKKKYNGGGYVKKFDKGGSTTKEETLAQKRYRDAVNASRKGVGLESLPPGYWGEPFSSVLDHGDYWSNVGQDTVKQIDRDNKQARDILTGGWDNDSSIASNVLNTIPRGLASIVPTANAAWKGMGLPVTGALDMLFGSDSKQPDSKSLLEGFNELRKPPKPWTDVNILPFTPDNEGTSPEEFNAALESGEPSDIVATPAQEQLKEDSLTTALKAMIMQEIEDRKGRKEPGPPTLFGREINMPLLKMGLGILANSGYPNSAGEAIGKGILGALSEEEQAQLAKSKRNNDKLKELLNLRYMQGMVESMDPNIKMQLQRERATQEMTQKALEKQQEYELRMSLYEAQRKGRVEDALAIAKGKIDAENAAMFGNMGEDEGINVD